MDDAVSHGFQALRHARRVTLDRQADVLATLGVVLAYAGRTDEALRRFEEAVPITSPRELPRLYLRRAHVLAMLARYREAVDDATRAIGGLHWNHDTLWEARAYNNRFDALLALGETEAAEADAVRAEQLFPPSDRTGRQAQSMHNRALAAHQRGDLPEALTLLDQADRPIRRAGQCPSRPRDRQGADTAHGRTHRGGARVGARHAGRA